MKKLFTARWAPFFGGLIGIVAFSAFTRAEVVAHARLGDVREGWEGEQMPGNVSWEQDGQLSITFPPAGDQPPQPGMYALWQADSAFADGAFTGNYLQADVAFIGFDFRAVGAFPRNGLRVELWSGTQHMYSELLPRIPSLGDWHRLLIRVDDRVAGGWLPADDELFHAVLANVDAVRIYVGHSYTDGAVYQLDHVFLGRSHRTTGLRMSDGRPAIQWEGLLNLGAPAGAVSAYQVETTTNISARVWTPVEHIDVLADGTAEWTLPEESDHEGAMRFFRLKAQ